MNEIISGYRSGAKFQEDPNNQLVHIGSSEYITKNLVSSVNLINSTTEVNTSGVLTGAAIAGAVGALASIGSVTEILVEINWNNGEKSIAKVSKSVFERILIGLGNDYTQSDIKNIENERINNKSESEKNALMIATAVTLVVGNSGGSNCEYYRI